MITLLLTIAFAKLVHAETLEIEIRGDRTCARQICLARLPLGEHGFNLTEQVSRFEADFTENLEPKVAGTRLSYESLLAVAAATGLSPANRARLVREFSSLTVRELSSNARAVAAAAKDEGSKATKPLEIAFHARLDWRDHAGHAGTTALSGRLVFPRDRPFAIDRSSAEINLALSSLVAIDAVSSEVPTRDQIVTYVAPAALSHLIVLLLTPPEHLADSPLRATGAYLRGDG